MSSSTTPYTQLSGAPGAVDATRQASNWRGNESKHANVEDHRPINEQGNDYGFDPGTIPFAEPDESLLKSQALNEERGCDAPSIKYPILCLAGLTGVGCCFVVSKTNIIRQDEIGIVTQMDGGVHLLTSGCHASGCCTDIRRFKVRSNRIVHGNMHIIRIPAGNFGKAWRNGVAEFLLPGRHVVNDPLFEFADTISISTRNIKHGTCSIVTIPGNMIGKCIVNGKGFWLEPGRHFVNHPQFQYIDAVSRNTECITVGSKFRITVPAGKIGLAWDKGEPLVLEHGKVIERDSPFFKYVGSVPMTQSLIQHGSIKFCSVRQGLFGVSYDEGVLRILQPGRHTLTKPTHFLAGFLPSGQQTLSIEAVTSMSADNVGIKFDSALTIQVKDPEKAVTMLGIASNTAGRQSSGRASQRAASAGVAMDDSFDLESFYWNIVQQAKLALSIIIGNNKFNQSFRSTSKQSPVVVAEQIGSPDDGQKARQGKQVGSPVRKSKLTNPEDALAEDEGSFKQHIHDLFMLKFSENMLGECGVMIVDMSIEDVIITNDELAKAMSQAAVSATKLDSARIEVEERRMRAEGQARSMKILAQAEADRIRTLDDAMSKICDVTQQRELIRSTGDALEKGKSSVLLGKSFVDVTRMISGMGN
jgi:regulator of protease activity HflC (stomatin/prohibitin superfamily)